MIDDFLTGISKVPQVGHPHLISMHFKYILRMNHRLSIEFGVSIVCFKRDRNSVLYG